MKTESEILGVPASTLRDVAGVLEQENRLKQLFGGTMSDVNQWQKLARDVREREALTSLRAGVVLPDSIREIAKLVAEQESIADMHAKMFPSTCAEALASLNSGRDSASSLAATQTNEVLSSLRLPAFASTFAELADAEKIESGTATAYAQYQRALEAERESEREMLTRKLEQLDSPSIAFTPAHVGPTMADLMREHDKEQQKRHQEQLAVVRRLADAAEVSAEVAKESKREAGESLKIANGNTVWARLGVLVAVAALVISAWPHIVAILLP